jgi:hypothetical protein
MNVEYEESEKVSKSIRFESYSLYGCVQNHYSDPNLWDEVARLRRRREEV